jgi:DNA-binding protein H-NS
MNLLRASVVATLGLAASMASAQGTSTSFEERLQKLEAEQAAMKQQQAELQRQLAERDARIRQLESQLQGPGTAPASPPAAVAPAPAESVAGAPPAASGGVVAPPLETPGEVPDKAAFVPDVDTWGVYDPGTGFVVGRSDFGELDISAYAMARYLDQHDSDGVFKDHFGNERAVDPRTDIFSHRILVFLKGWMGSEKLIYNITLWTVNATDQDAIFANLGYQFSKKFSLYAGLTGNPGSRSLSGSHPYWLAHDRVMADEFFRPYFGSGIYATGEALPGLWYTASVANNNSALGVKASQLDRKFSYGGTIWWMPTTKEFGPRGGYGDWEWHEQVATRVGVSAFQSPEQSFRSTTGGNPDNTTLRLADSVNLFETGSLAPGVTIDTADYRVLAVDAGMKYHGIFLQAEYYQRWLDNFVADGILPVREVNDTGFYVQASFFPVKQKLELYGITSQIYGDDDAGFSDSSEYGIGMNYYPYPTRNHRLNLQLLDVNKSPVSSTFGYYTGGQDGWTVASSFSVFF